MIRFDDRRCFICGSSDRVELHHIFGGMNRKRADEDGLTVFLCARCHREGRYSVHGSGEAAQLLHAVGELMWLRTHPDADVWDFARRYGKNYLRDWEDGKR